jgi:mono/diheme cytochrome c family protein
MKKYLLGGLVCLVVLVGAALGYLVLRKPAMAPPSPTKIEATAARLERGEYLFHTLLDCGGCHSDRDITKFAAPFVAGGTGMGRIFPPELGLPGRVVPSNITPDPETGIGTWTDGEKIRAIREGISKDGRALFPMMPYPYFRTLPDEDVYSLVAYLDSLPPVKNKLPKTELNFPVNLMIKSAPRPVIGVVPPIDKSNPVKYGEHLVKVAGCITCHTPEERGEIIKGKEFGGGREFNYGKYTVRSANITPDPETGIGAWDEHRFLSKFRGYQAMAEGTPPPANQGNFTLMPWLAFAKASDEDLRAIFAYLKTLRPINNPVEVHPQLAAF